MRKEIPFLIKLFTLAMVVDFLTECLSHYKNHDIVRLLLADDGLGKTFSLGIANLALCLLQDRNGGRRKPVVIFAPAALCEQLQTSMANLNDR